MRQLEKACLILFVNNFLVAIWSSEHSLSSSASSSSQWRFGSPGRSYAGAGPPISSNSPTEILAQKQSTTQSSGAANGAAVIPPELESTAAPSDVRSTPPPPKRYKCVDRDMNCYNWVASEPDKCSNDTFVIEHCRRVCRNCTDAEEDGWRPNMKTVSIQSLIDAVPEKYDLRKVPENLRRLAFLVGRWRSDFGGKADFPTIPRFTYGEELDFTLSTLMNTPVLNYMAFAWDNSDLTELHSENGFLTGKGNTSWVALNTVMSNGFLTVEEGEEDDNSIRFRLQRIGRLNFSRDLPVIKMIREWTLLNQTHMESRLMMATTTHRMLLHTRIIYKRIYP